MNVLQTRSPRTSLIGNSIFLAAAILLHSGCSTPNQMALKDKGQRIDTSKEGIAIVTLTATNDVKPTWPPLPLEISVESRQADGSTKQHSFPMGPQWNEVNGQSGVYIISLKLPPGEHLLKEIRGVSEKSMAFVSGKFTIPLFAKSRVGLGQIVYLGRIHAVNRPRKNDQELRAGSLFPLIDQLSTGYSGGTFDVEFVDKFDEDMSLLKSKFPNLEGQKIEKTILPPWKRPSGKGEK